MNCIKPSGPYIAFLAIVFSISFIGIPKNGGNKLQEESINFADNKELKEGRLEQIEQITMLNTNNHE